MKSEKLKVCVLEWGMRNSKSQGLKAKSKVEVEVKIASSFLLAMTGKTRRLRANS
ncbi:MAG: hypothetical protein RBR40_06945 [Tenuifilaceae bacterium]|nr:hypothetical protein [Tenuifilaceae bacterium]